MSPTHAQLGNRSLFPELQARVYLAHAAVSPISTPVQQAIEQVIHSYAQQGFGAFPQWIQQRLTLKSTLSRLLHCQPEDLALVQSTTSGLLAIALCVPWQAGDAIVLTEGEFPANVTPWQQVAARFGLEIQWLPQPLPEEMPMWLEGLRETLAQTRARVVTVSAVQFQTGLAMPLQEIGEICHEFGAELCVDAVQAVGAVPLDLHKLPIDYLAAGAHKWMNAVEGAGFVYISPRVVHNLRPTWAGWLSHEDGLGFLLRGAGHLRHDRPIRQSADFLEIGNVSSLSFAAMGAAADTLESLGIPEIFAHVQPILDALENGLTARGFVSLRARDPHLRSCTLAMRTPADVDVLDLQHQLADLGVATSAPDGLLRLAPHWPNHLTEVPMVLAAMDKALVGMRSGKSNTLPRGS